MYDVQTTKQFDKSFKKCLKRNCNPELLWEVIGILQETGSLPMQYHPHKLSGKFEGLLWQQNDTELVLIMTDTGTHADLF